jgi:hypothetical protein
MQDLLGNPVTVRQAATLAAIDDFIEGYLAYERRAERIVAASGASRNIHRSPA